MILSPVIGIFLLQAREGTSASSHDHYQTVLLSQGYHPMLLQVVTHCGTLPISLYQLLWPVSFSTDCSCVLMPTCSWPC